MSYAVGAHCAKASTEVSYTSKQLGETELETPLTSVSLCLIPTVRAGIIKTIWELKDLLKY